MIGSKLALIFIIMPVQVLDARMTWTTDDRKVEMEQAAEWEKKLTDAKLLDPQDKIERLALGLRNMGYGLARKGTR